MKKKMGILGGLAMVTMLSIGSVAGTYAKYTSALDFADEARVATWEFKLNGQTTTKDLDINLFAESYEVATDMSAKDKGDVATDVVSSEEGVKVVAPGTRGTYTFNLTGTAETNYTVSFDAVLENTIKTEDYNPIFFRLNNGDWMNAEAFQTYLNTTIKADTSKVYAANYNLNESYTIDWMWAFDKEDATQPEGTDFESDDVKDTFLAGQNGTVSLSVKLTVTQSELEATEKAPVTPEAEDLVVSNDAVNATYSAALVTQFNYDASKNSVTMGADGKLTGTMASQAQDTIDAFWGAGNGRTEGYYYPVVFTNVKAGDTLVINGKTSKTVTVDEINDGQYVIFMELHKNGNNEGNKTFTVEREGKVLTIDYTGVTFE